MRSKRNFILLSVLLLSAIFINISIILFRFKLTTILKQVLWKNDELPVYLVTGIDRLLADLNPKGNVFIKFIGFADNSPCDKESWGAPKDAASIIYFRSVFYLYPRLVYTGPENLKVVRGFEFLGLNFFPDSKWFSEHNITDMLVFERDMKGNIKVETCKLPSGH